jgi:hypothetical protein
MRFQAAALALAGAAAVSAQTGGADVPEYGSALDIKIDPNSVAINTRADWCVGQRNTCRILCGQSTNANDCDVQELSFDCKCASNDSAPGLQYYTQTLPTYICFEANGQCQVQFAGDAEGQEDCNNNILALCAEQNPPDPEDIKSSTTEGPTGTSTTAAPTGQPTGGNEGTQNGDPSTLTTTESDGFAAPTMAPAANGLAAAAAIGLLAYLV